MLKKDNDSMKMQLRNVMQDKMRLARVNRELEEDMKELKQEVVFYKARRVEELGKISAVY